VIHNLNFIEKHLNKHQIRYGSELTDPSGLCMTAFPSSWLPLLAEYCNCRLPTCAVIGTADCRESRTLLFISGTLRTGTTWAQILSRGTHTSLELNSARLKQQGLLTAS